MWERTRQSAESRRHRGFRRSWLWCSVAWIGIALWCPSLGAQEAPQTVTTDAPTQNSAAAETEREVTWRTLPRNFLQDQKDVWLFPVQLAKGRHWLPALAVTGVTAGLVLADPHDTPYFRRTARFEGFHHPVSGRHTLRGIAGVPPAVFVCGHFPHAFSGGKTVRVLGCAG